MAKCDYPFSIFTHLAIVLSVLLFTACDYPFSIFTHLAIVLSVLRFTACDTQAVKRKTDNTMAKCVKILKG
jgi:hypothetical protein